MKECFTSTAIGDNVVFCIDEEEVVCNCENIVALSNPFHAMLFGCFTESQRTKIDFSHNGISVQGMRAVDEFHDMDVISISGNFCADKKPTTVNWIEGHFH